MKNIQIIDRADNATYSIFSATEDEFKAIFPEIGQDMELADDFVSRVGEPEAIKILTPLWERPIHKPHVTGIHGTLYYGFESERHHFPESKRELDRPAEQLNTAQRTLYKQIQ